LSVLSFPEPASDPAEAPQNLIN